MNNMDYMFCDSVFDKDISSWNIKPDCVVK